MEELQTTGMEAMKLAQRIRYVGHLLGLTGFIPKDTFKSYVRGTSSHNTSELVRRMARAVRAETVTATTGVD